MSHRTHHGHLVEQHTERVFAEPAFWLVYLLFAALILIALAGCAGGGPLGNGLGETVANITVTDAKGQACTVAITNGKDQTNLTLRGLRVCGGSLDELHADRSDGAQAAINANAAVANHAIDVGAGLAGDALAVLGVPHAGPKPPPPAPVPAPLPPFPAAAGDAPLRDYLERRTLQALESPEP